MMRHHLFHSLAAILRRHHDHNPHHQPGACPVCDVAAEIADLLEDSNAMSPAERTRFGVEAGVLKEALR
jgi:hypothetical protein